jgi:hypothetical protein
MIYGNLWVMLYWRKNLAIKNGLKAETKEKIHEAHIKLPATKINSVSKATLQSSSESYPLALTYAQCKYD